MLFEGEEHEVSHDLFSVNKMLFNISFVWGGSDGIGGGGVSARVSQVRRAYARTVISTVEKKVTQTVNEFNSLIRTSEHILALGREKGMIYPHHEYSACCSFEENINKRITAK